MPGPVKSPIPKARPKVGLAGLAAGFKSLFSRTPKVNRGRFTNRGMGSAFQNVRPGGGGAFSLDSFSKKMTRKK